MKFTVLVETPRMFILTVDADNEVDAETFIGELRKECDSPADLCVSGDLLELQEIDDAYDITWEVVDLWPGDLV